MPTTSFGGIQLSPAHLIFSTLSTDFAKPRDFRQYSSAMSVTRIAKTTAAAMGRFPGTGDGLVAALGVGTARAAEIGGPAVSPPEVLPVSPVPDPAAVYSVSTPAFIPAASSFR